MRKREKQIKLNKKVILILIIIIAIIVTAVMLLTNNKETIEYSAELLRSQSYDEVKDGEEEVTDSSGNKISQVEFDAFFLKDIDSDGAAESIRGTCNEVGSQATLYMELVVQEEGYITNSTITINSNNFYFNTSIVKDNEIAQNYISTNTKTISLNDVEEGTQKLIIGSVRSRRLLINKHNKVCNWK